MADSELPSPPPVVPPPAKPTPPTAIWSLVLGILSFVCAGIFAAIPAVICGHVARSTIRKSSGELGGKGLALTGLILGYVAILLNIILIPTLIIPAVLESFNERYGSTGFKNEIVSANGTERITAPATWKSLPELKEGTSVAAGHEAEGEYLIVVCENKADRAGFSLEKHHQVTRDSAVGTLKNGSASASTSLTVDGHPALQDEISGISDNTNIVLLHTTVDHGKYFHQILGWTLKSKWELKKPRLQAVTLSFRSTH